MATSVPPKKNTALVFYVALASQADPKLFQVNPTLATGDVKVSTDGGAYANITTLPVVTPSGGRDVKVSLSASEMNGDDISVIFSDAAGAEWCDKKIAIKTSARWVDDLAYPATTGRSLAVDVSGNVAADVKLWLASAPAALSANGYLQVMLLRWLTDNAGGTPNALQSGRVDGYAGAIANDVITAAAIATDAIGAAELAADAVLEIQTGLSTLTQANVRSAVGLASANLDTQLGTIFTSAGSAATSAASADSKASSILTNIAALPAAVWDRLTSALTTAGSIGKYILDSFVATLAQVNLITTGTSVTIVSPTAAGGTVYLRRGDTITLPITGLGSLSGRTKLWFGVKQNAEQADTEAILLIEETAGLLYLNGAVPADSGRSAGEGDITVTDEAAGNITVTLSAAAAALLGLDTLLTYDVQLLVGSTVTTLALGSASVVEDIVRATS